MPRTINHNGELFRIDEVNNRIEYSANDGHTWTTRYIGRTIGRFIQLINFGNRLIACTSNGLYQSTNRGRSWTPLYTGKIIGTIIYIKENGKQLFATTSKGLFISADGGRIWTPSKEEPSITI